MSKIKYYQLAVNENNHSMLFVSASQKVIDKAVNDGYTVFGFDNKADIPVNPILDNGAVREMTEAEISAQAVADEAAYQDAKSTAEKKRDNWALTIIATMKVKYPDVTLTAQDISRSSEELAPLLIDQGVSDEDSEKLMQVKISVGESKLPAQLHVIEG